LEVEGELEDIEDVTNPKRERAAQCAREANVGSCLAHPQMRAPRGRAPRQGAGCPREWPF
jgi:hypothetical protein